MGIQFVRTYPVHAHLCSSWAPVQFVPTGCLGGREEPKGNSVMLSNRSIGSVCTSSG
jgi:hypothetical protein